MKQCSKCKQLKALSDYNKKSSNKDGLERYCKDCHRVKNKKHYQDNKQSYIDQALKNRSQNRDWLFEYKKTLSCSRCGEDKHWRLSFHHINPATKSFNIATSYGSVSRDKLVEEIRKCIPVCHNCHADIHYEERIGVV